MTQAKDHDSNEFLSVTMGYTAPFGCNRCILKAVSLRIWLIAYGEKIDPEMIGIILHSVKRVLRVLYDQNNLITMPIHSTRFAYGFRIRKMMKQKCCAKKKRDETRPRCAARLCNNYHHPPSPSVLNYPFSPSLSAVR